MACQLRIRCLQHVPFEGPAAIADWADSNRYALGVTRLDRGEELPSIASFDWLVVLGGPMGVADRARHVWMDREIELIGTALEAGRRVLGICLGAQLLASALGARVYRAPAREIGWLEVESCPAAIANFGWPHRFVPLHWHGDTFDLPAGAECLASGPMSTNQAFAVGSNAVGLQFHLEATPQSVKALVSHCAAEIGSGDWEMPPEAIVDCRARCRQLRPVLHGVLERLARDPGELSR